MPETACIASVSECGGINGVVLLALFIAPAPASPPDEAARAGKDRS
jgi:hypothetical protein